VFVSQNGDSPAGVGSFGGGAAGTSVSIMSTANLMNSMAPGGCSGADGGLFVDTPVTAVAFAPDGRLLAQTVNPPQLLVMEANQVPNGALGHPAPG
jgi:hypothetical protein